MTETPIKLSLKDLEGRSQEELLIIAQQVKDLKKARQFKKLDYYTKNMHKGQETFHRCDKRQVYLLAGNRFGKSTAGFVELAWLCLGIHPYKKNKVPLKTAIVLQDFENHGKAILESKINEWTPQGSIKKIERHQGGCVKRIIWVTGSTTDVFSHDQDQKVFEGSDFDVIWFDEPPPKHIWVAMWRSCTDRGGRMYLTGTPLASQWLYDEYNRWKGNENSIAEFLSFPSEMNAKNLGEGDESVGKKRLNEFAEGLNEEEKEARLNGGFVQLSGLIFKNWDRKVHLIKPFDWPSNWEIWESIDPHPQKDWALSYVGFAPNGAKILIHSQYVGGVIDDIANGVLTARDSLPIKEKLKPRIARTLIDNASSVPTWQRSNTDLTTRRVSVREELENMIGPRGAGGPRIETCPKNVKNKIDFLKNWLHVKDRAGVMRPDFYVFDSQDNESFIYEIENYIWDRYRNKQNQEFKDKPVKKNDDLLDTVMQVCLTVGSGARPEIEGPQSFVKSFGTWGMG
jgi:hypothetical protein